MKLLFRISLAILSGIYSLSAFGQSPSSVNALVSQVNGRHRQLPVEKLYLQTDKNNYLQNDTLWFKAYLFNADYLTPSPLSGLLYAEVDDSNNKCVKRMMFPVVSGLSWGNISLDEDDIPEGSYTLRAYTNWMRNFGEDAVFKKQIYIAPAAAVAHLITTDFKQTNKDGKNNMQAGILFSRINGQPLRLQNMRFKVTDGRHVIARAEMSTGVDGKLKFNFDLPPNTDTKNLSITVKDITKGTETAPYTIPVNLFNPENTDIQFMPEGGQLVAGIPCRIGFKAIGENGMGVDVSGAVYNSRQQQVATFKSAHLGMGWFGLAPQAGQIYTAQVTLPNGGTKTYALPPVSLSGASLSVRDNPASDSLRVTVAATPGPLNTAADDYLIGLSRGVVCYAAHFIIKDEAFIIRVPKSAFPSGIAHFTLLNSANLPLAERIVYINYHDNLQINIIPDKKTYVPHDSIALHLQVTDHSGKPVAGSFSMAVTDDSQVKTDSMSSNIVNNLLLTSDLKGYVEDPAYYFEDDSPERATDLDNLLLTQGWVGYDWKQVFGPETPPVYAAEPEFTIMGTVTNIFNKPVAGSQVTLLSKKPAMVTDTITDKDGRFTFKGFLPVDTASFLIQARNKRGKSFNVGVDVDEFKPPVFTQTAYPVMPWYVNTDTLLLHNLGNNAAKQLAEAKLEGTGHLLKEVVIKSKKVIKDSKNLNGPGGADEALDEQDMLKAGKMTLEDLLKLKIKGFHEGYYRHTVIPTYLIYDEPVNFVFDGMYLNRFYTPTPEMDGFYHYVKQYLQYYTAEDITGIEIMYNPEYNSNYITTFLNPMLVGDPIAFIEITTRGGVGPFMQKVPGTYIYRPLAATLPAQFYRPRYAAKSPITGTDLRSTLHWQPNIITDTAGKATVSFYSADKAANYTIMVEGADLNGGIGFKRGKVVVK